MKRNRRSGTIRFPFMNRSLKENFASCTTARQAPAAGLAVIVTERDDILRVVTAYDLDSGQKREYLRRRMKEGR
jgi:hypothetical protein